MAIHYIDPVGGSLATNGSSFADRARQFSQLPALTANDEIRVIASPDPVALGTAQWTDDSRDIVFGSPLPIQVVDNCEEVWTAAANVTATRQSAAGVEGAYGARLSIAAAFTTGKIAHRTLPAPLNLSAFDKLTWQIGGTLTRWDYINLVLCSDTDGNVPVHTMPFAAILAENYGLPAGGTALTNFVPSRWSAGGPLGSDIRSVALYATTDPGNTSAMSIEIDNIVAVTEASGIDHAMLIGKNTEDEPYWYNIKSIAADAISIGPPETTITQNATQARPYWGNTEAVPTYAQAAFPWPYLSAGRTLNMGAITGVKVTGGWDRTDMSTKTGRTFARQWLATSGLVVAPTANRIVDRIEGFTVIANAGSLFTGNSATLNQIADCDLISFNGGDPYPLSSDVTDNPPREFGIGWFCQSAQVAPLTGSSGFNNTRRINIDAILCTQSSTAAIRPSTNIDGKDSGRPHIPFHVKRIWSTGTSAAIQCAYGGAFRGPTDIRGAGAKAQLVGNATCVVTGIPLTPEECTTASTNRGRIVTEDMMFQWGGNVRMQSTVVNFSATALQFKPTSTTNVHAGMPLAFCVAQIACQAGVPITVKGWGRKDNAGLTMQLAIPDGSLGIEGEQVAAVSEVNAWEELSITVTPVYSGILPVYGYAWGGTTFNGYLGDLSWEAA